MAELLVTVYLCGIPVFGVFLGAAMVWTDNDPDPIKCGFLTAIWPLAALMIVLALFVGAGAYVASRALLSGRGEGGG